LNGDKFIFNGSSNIQVHDLIHLIKSSNFNFDPKFLDGKCNYINGKKHGEFIKLTMPLAQFIYICQNQDLPDFRIFRISTHPLNPLIM